jgi:hypothetical protein
MKTKQEMIYDFMLALAPTFQKIQDDLVSGNNQIDISEVADMIYMDADALATSYLEGLE